MDCPSDRDRDATPPSSEWVRDATWARSLARKLVSDGHEADDLVQESMLAALAGGGPPRAPRRFFARVVKNLAALEQRRRCRRQRRERACAQPEGLPSALDTIEHKETQALLADVVDGLAPHYRDVVLLRFYDDCKPAEIAARLGVPVSTVKTRLARAQAAIREQLRRRTRDDGRGWFPALVALCVGRPMGRRMAFARWALAAGLVLALPAGAWRSCGTGPLPPLPTSAVSIAALSAGKDRAGATPRAATAPLEPRAQASAVAVPTAINSAATLEPGVVLRGRVLADTGLPVAAAVVRLRPHAPARANGELVSISDAHGRFSFHRYWPGGRIDVVSESWVTVLAGETAAQGPCEVNVVVARPRAVVGRVLDTSGQPVAGARCRVVLPADFRARLAVALDAASTVGTAVDADADGCFGLTLPVVPGAVVRVRKAGFIERAFAVEAIGPRLPVTLVGSAAGEPGPKPPAARTVRGRVCDPDGRGLAGVEVWGVGAASRRDGARQSADAITAAGGWFEICELAPATGELAVIEPKSLTRVNVPLPRTSGDVLTVVLDPTEVLGEMHGRVVDDLGRAVAAAEVRVGTDISASFGDAASTRWRTSITTGRDGSFRLRDVPRVQPVLEVRGVGVLPLRRDLSADRALTVVVQRAVRLRIELVAPRGGECFAILAEDGCPLPLHHFRGLQWEVSTRGRLHAGRSETVRVSARARRVVVYREGALVAKREIALGLGALHCVRLAGGLEQSR